MHGSPEHAPNYSGGHQPHSKHESGGSSDLPAFVMREKQGGEELSHEQLVQAFRGLLWQKRLSYGEFTPNFPPAAIIRQELDHKTGPDIVYDPQRKEFFTTLRDAWDVIAYEHYRWKRTGEDAAENIRARWDLSLRHWNAKDRQESQPEIITLGPLQVKILDALAEAANIPHQRGQTEITIPEHLRHYAEESFKEDERRRADKERRRGK